MRVKFILARFFRPLKVSTTSPPALCVTPEQCLFDGKIFRVWNNGFEGQLSICHHILFCVVSNMDVFIFAAGVKANSKEGEIS